MDIKKLLLDIVTLNFKDLSQRFRKLNRRLLRIHHKNRHPLPNPENIPVIINNRDRFTYLKELIAALEKIGFQRIIVLDNESTYPPLLEYYQSTSHEIIFLNKNGGPRSIWETETLRDFLSDYYIYTDPDVIPSEQVDLALIREMLHTLDQHISLEKIGLGLRIDDLPEHYKLKQEVIKWESQWHQNSVSELYFKAPVDTTFALYAPYQQGGGECNAYRTKAPYDARHLPWYENSSLPSEEEIYYRKHAASNASHWTELTK